MKITERRADELQVGDKIVMEVSSVERTATGYVMVRRGGKLITVPPSEVFAVSAD